MAGCDYVLHVASPLGADHPKDPDALIVPARDGTLRVLRAATKAEVRRVVMTSSCAAASPSRFNEDSVTDESLWTNPEDRGLNAYRKSKTLAEQAAWQFMGDYNGPTTLTTILPGAVFGPVLSMDKPGSVQVIGRLLRDACRAIPAWGSRSSTCATLPTCTCARWFRRRPPESGSLPPASSCGWPTSRRRGARNLERRPARFPRGRCRTLCCDFSRCSILGFGRSCRA